MTILKQGRRDAEHIMGEGPGTLSREAILITAGPALPPGQVLGIVTTTGHYAPYDKDNTDGSEDAAAVLYAGIPASAEVRTGAAIVRHAELNGALLTGFDEEARPALEARQLIVR
ncbi:head decoration protein [Chitinolyticbacter meiyuanensis]|uniref:head decoration protein n=1 Tax=Chitinolyticbacter meiyuanensis TaxID=682798 RepID=UPI0011E59566|nr:head decoration protein [Chitinolyticbacter meiyuanensis]